MYPEIEEILISQQQLEERIEQMARQLRTDYGEKNPLFVGILRSCYVFMADIIRRFDAPCTVDFLAVSSYGSNRDGIVLSRDIGTAPMGRHVVVLEALLDSGRTMSFVSKLLSRRNVQSLSICTLLDKPSNREMALQADYVGFTIPDRYVVGYGLDHEEHYRNLPYIGVLPMGQDADSTAKRE